jgi:ribosome-binding factor A
MANSRVMRLAEQIKREISKIIQNDLKDPRVAFLTVTGTELTNDLSIATIYVSIYGTDEEIKNSLETLNRAKGHIRTELGKRIRFRSIPELIFKQDTSIDYAYRIEELLNEIKEKE